MSKQVKELITSEIKNRLSSIQDCLVVNVVGMNAIKTTNLRKALRGKNISVVVVKNNLARRATEGTSLHPAFLDLKGSSAVVYGCEDFVSLVKEIVEIQAQEKEFPGFETRGGVMDGEALNPNKVKEIAKWPNRREQLSMLVGQIMGPGSKLAGQLKGPGGKLAGQIKKLAGEE
jgi:large subunit ribosomal protein L10